MTARFSCAAAAYARDEPRYATASTVRRWLLIEQPGPWGASAIRESRIPSVAAEALIDLGKRLSARVLLIRRPAGRASDGTHVYVAHTGVRSRWLQSFVVDAPQAALDLDLEPLRRGRSVDGRPEDDPLLLVCTNGRHDPCCAEFGRPVADALAAGYGELVWEVSHIGGDRFAGNVVVLPDGIYYGGLDADRAVRVAQSHLTGHIELGAYRGRSAQPFVVQAAEHFLRREHRLTGLDAVRWTDREALADDRWRITFATPAGMVQVDVGVGREDEPRQLTCRAPQLARPPRYDLLALRPGGAEA
ncbi:MAG TPA: sucrase ferredoxin [Euzebyales bacterium]|nr:sucrase ferredoxin [Euzebyales bacterium]